MKYQTNPELGPYINLWGCDICSILSKVEKKSGYTWSWTNDQIVEVYKKGILAKFIQEEVANPDGSPLDGCDVEDYAGFYNLAAEYAGIKSVCVEMRFEDHLYEPLANEEEILELKRANHAGSHFVAGNGNTSPTNLETELEFDPIEGGSITAAQGWIASKRILVF